MIMVVQIMKEILTEMGCRIFQIVVPILQLELKPMIADVQVIRFQIIFP